MKHKNFLNENALNTMWWHPKQWSRRYPENAVSALLEKGDLLAMGVVLKGGTPYFFANSTEKSHIIVIGMVDREKLSSDTEGSVKYLDAAFSLHEAKKKIDLWHKVLYEEAI